MSADTRPMSLPVGWFLVTERHHGAGRYAVNRFAADETQPPVTYWEHRPDRPYDQVDPSTILIGTVRHATGHRGLCAVFARHAISVTHAIGVAAQQEVSV